jgi:hypothetical protein
MLICALGCVNSYEFVNYAGKCLALNNKEYIFITEKSRGPFEHTKKIFDNKFLHEKTYLLNKGNVVSHQDKKRFCGLHETSIL